MNKVLNKMRKRNIRSNFKQFLSVIFIVLLSTMLLSGFITNAYTLNSCVDHYFEETNLADLFVYTDYVSAEDEKFLQENNIKYDKRLYFETKAEIKSLQIHSTAKFYVYDGKISTPYVESGKTDCLIDKNVAKNHHIKAGFDNIDFTYVYDYSGRQIELDFSRQLTGTMSLDECADSYSSWAVLINKDVFISELKTKLANHIIGFDADNFELPYNQILIKTDNILETTKLLKSHYEREGTDSKLLYLLERDSVESVNLLKQEVIQSQKMIYVFPIIFLVVAVLIILTTIDQLILQERKRIGILKCCGVPNRKILSHYSFYGATLCAIGAVLGTIFGIFLIPDIMFSRYGTIYSIPEDYIVLKIPTWWLSLMVLSIILLGYLVSLLSCRKMLNKNPVECLKYDLNTSAKRLKKRKKQYKKMPISLKMALRNIKIKPLRTVMASFGIAGCVALLISGFGIGDTISKSLKNDFGKVFNYDVSSTYRTEDFVEKINSDNRINYAEKYERVYANAEFDGKTDDVYVYEVQENSKILSFKLIKNEVCISKSIANDLDLNLGDIISVTLQDKKYNFAVNRIVETSVLNGVFVCKDLAFSNSSTEKCLWINCNNDIDGVVNFANEINGTNTAVSITAQKEAVETRIMSTKTITTTIKIFATLLAVVVLLNLILLIIKERTTEIATLKVMGLSSLDISISVFIEVMIMVLFGMVVGMALGFPLMLWILSVNKIQIMNFIFGINFVSFLISAVIVIVTILGVLLFTYLKIRKVDMCGSLKNVE